MVSLGLLGRLTLKGKTETIEFPAKVEMKDGVATGTAKIEVDRTKWGLNYGSGNFFTELVADKIINGEQCDDGNMNDNDGCSNACTLPLVSTAFRMNDLDLRDPHVHVNFLGCRDVTDVPFGGFAVNDSLQTSITTDGPDADNFRDLSLVTVFRPLVQVDNGTTTLQLHFPNCTAPLASTTCAPVTNMPTAVMSTSFTTAQCLAPVAGSVHTMPTPYVPNITSATAACYRSGTFTATINLAGIPVILRNAQLAATWLGTPATNTVNGLFMGFLSEADADGTVDAERWLAAQGRH